MTNTELARVGITPIPGMLCRCGICQVAVVNDPQSKLKHMRRSCFISGFQQFYFNKKGMEYFKHDKGDFRSMTPPDVVLPEIVCR